MTTRPAPDPAPVDAPAPGTGTGSAPPTTEPVLVVGATGTVGAHLPRELLRRGHQVRAFVRDADRAARRLGHQVDLAVGDLADRASLDRALDGVRQVFLAAANHPDQVTHENAVIDAAAAAGVRRLVKLSNQGAQVGSPAAFWDANARIEEHLRRSGLPWVVLRPSSFLTNLLSAAPAVRQAGALPVPAGDAAVTFVDPRDVAAVAAAVLTADATRGHEGRTYVVTGPEALTLDDVAAQLSDAVGRAVRYVPVPDGAAQAAMTALGLPEWTARQIVEVWAQVRRGVHSVPTDVVAVVTGHEPRTTSAFLAEHAEVFR